MLLYNLKFYMHYRRSHYHCVMMRKAIQKQNNYLDDPKKFKYYGQKALHHARRFDEIQITIDELHDKIVTEYPELKEEL